MTHKPSEQQAAIIEAAGLGKSILCSAGAGCAKTSTIVMLAPELKGPATAMAFNVSIKKELEQRLPPTITCLTANGLGHRAWQKVVTPKLTVNAYKCGEILTPLLEEFKLEREESSTVFSSVVRLVSLAKSAGIVPPGFNYKGLLPDESDNWQELADEHWIDAPTMVVDLARETLRLSIKEAYQGKIDFDDQIYMSVLFGAPYDHRRIMLVDEAQDLSPINHLQITKSNPEQLIVVGDPRQAIYGFRGADSKSMANLVSKFPRLSFEYLSLSVTYRCPKLVVKRQLEHYPSYEAHESNKAGTIKTLHSWGIPDLPTTTCAILCRNNAPILSLAFKLLRNKIQVKVLGSDIAKNLKTLLKKAIHKSDKTTEDLFRSIKTWEDAEINKAAGRRNRIESIRDRADSMRAVCENAHDLDSALTVLNQIFSQEGRVELATAHKAKGLEWDWVMHLDPWRVPSKFATAAAAEGNERPLEQENNIRYVIETRTKDTLVFANLEDWQD